MDPRRNDEQQEDMMWSSRRVRVPARTESVPARSTASPQLPEKPHEKAIIPLLDDEDEEVQKTVDINITFPTLPKLPARASIRKKAVSTVRVIKKQSKRRRVGALAAIVIVAGLSYQYGPFRSASTGSSGGSIAGVKSEKIVQTPEYATILPAGKKIEDFGGWRRVSPPDRNPVFAYPDKIDETSITVSQQPIPDTLKSGSESIEDLAKSYSATERVTAGDIVAYIGTSAKGPQSVIFLRDDLLVLIKSTDKLTQNQWATYISSLQ